MNEFGMDTERSISPQMTSEHLMLSTSSMNKCVVIVSEDDNNYPDYEECNECRERASGAIVFSDVWFNETAMNTSPIPLTEFGSHDSDLSFGDSLSFPTPKDLADNGELDLAGDNAAKTEEYEERGEEEGEEGEEETEVPYQDEAKEHKLEIAEDIAAEDAKKKNGLLFCEGHDKSDSAQKTPTLFDLKQLDWKEIQNFEAKIRQPNVIVLPTYQNYNPTPSLSCQGYEIFDYHELIRAVQERYDNRVMEQEIDLQSSPNQPSPMSSSHDGYFTPTAASSSDAEINCKAASEVSDFQNCSDFSDEEIDVVAIEQPQVVSKPLVPIFQKSRPKPRRCRHEKKQAQIVKDRVEDHVDENAVANINGNLMKLDDRVELFFGRPIPPSKVEKLTTPDGEHFRAPPLSFTCLVSLCLDSSDEGHMPVSEMYEYVE